jgi:hypothetical protein
VAALVMQLPVMASAAVAVWVRILFLPVLLSGADCSSAHAPSAPSMFPQDIVWGMDLPTEHERYLSEEVFKQPVIVYNYPKDIKVGEWGGGGGQDLQGGANRGRGGGCQRGGRQCVSFRFGVPLTGATAL